VFGPGSVQVSEVMPITHPIVPLGQWVELFNPGTDHVDVGGLDLLVVPSDAGSYRLPSLELPPRGFVVVGQSTDPADNGGAPVQSAWDAGEMPLRANVLVALRVPGTTANVGALQFDGGVTAGVSAFGDPRAIQRSGSPLVCNSGMAPFGQTGSIGTPGAANQSCYPYTLTAITPAYEDISATGRKLFTGTTTADFDNKVTNIVLSPPFRYFGADFGQATVGTNGFIAMQTTTSTGSSNRTAPSTTTPTATIAPFWDNLNRKLTALDGSVYSERKAGYTVVQWHHYGAFRTEGTLDDFNFEVKLFDTGVIEFHYATMRNGGPIDGSDGSGATVWIEPPGALSALPVSINQPAPRQNTAWRFTPVP
jgi:hypothetical protein